MSAFGVAPVTVKGKLEAGLSWAVVRDPGQRTEKIIAYTSEEADAQLIADALKAVT